MKILVANLGSTSFKYRLFDMAERARSLRGGDRTDRLAGKPCASRSATRRQEQAARAGPCRGGPSVPWPN